MAPGSEKGTTASITAKEIPGTNSLAVSVSDWQTLWGLLQHFREENEQLNEGLEGMREGIAVRIGDLEERATKAESLLAVAVGGLRKCYVNMMDVGHVDEAALISEGGKPLVVEFCETIGITEQDFAALKLGED